MPVRVPEFLLAQRGRVRIRGVRTAKLTLAAVLSYLAALPVSANPKPVLAPLTALLVVQLTLYETLRTGLTRVISVLAGVLIAVLFTTQVGMSALSLGVVVAASLVAGRLLRLRDQMLEVPISAMLVLAVNGEHTVATGRVLETVVGTVVGVAVGTVVGPPLYVRPASEAIVGLSRDMAAVLRRTAEEVTGEYSREQAIAWLEAARGLGRSIDGAERSLGRAEESLRLNPRARKKAAAGPSLRSGLEALERAAVSMRGLARSLADRASGPSDETVYGEDVRGQLSHLLRHLADAVEAYGVVVGAESTGSPAEEAGLRDALAAAWDDRHGLRNELREEQRTRDEDAWELHGALLANVDRLLREIDVEARGRLRELWQQRRGVGLLDAGDVLRTRLKAASEVASTKLPRGVRAIGDAAVRRTR